MSNLLVLFPAAIVYTYMLPAYLTSFNFINLPLYCRLAENYCQKKERRFFFSSFIKNEIYTVNSRAIPAVLEKLGNEMPF